MKEKSMITKGLIPLWALFIILVLASCGPTPEKLLEAVKNNDVEAVKECLEGGIDPNGKIDSLSLLEYSIEKNEDIASLLVDNNANLETSKNVPLIHWALAADKTKLVESIAKKEGQADIRDVMGNTPLMVAIQKKNAVAIEALLKNGADVNATLKSTGETALHMFFRNKDYSKESETSDKIFNAFIEAKPDLSIADLQTATPLALATFGTQGIINLEYIRKLLENGADPNYVAQGTPILLFPVLKGQKEIVKIYLDNGANPNLKGKDGKTILRHAKDSIFLWKGDKKLGPLFQEIYDMLMEKK